MRDIKGFEVYTNFGKVLARFEIGDNLHHHAREEARSFLVQYEKTGKKAWVRLY